MRLPNWWASRLAPRPARRIVQATDQRDDLHSGDFDLALQRIRHGTQGRSPTYRDNGILPPHFLMSARLKPAAFKVADTVNMVALPVRSLLGR